jgi:hypothetical protein
LANPSITHSRQVGWGNAAKLEYLWLRLRIGLARYGLRGTTRRGLARASGGAWRKLGWLAGPRVR